MMKVWLPAFALLGAIYYFTRHRKVELEVEIEPREETSEGAVVEPEGA
jgi:hypothetical protein